MSREAQNDLGEIIVEAEARAGELLAAMDLKPGKKKVIGSTEEPIGSLPDGVTKKQSHNWQRIASVPEKDRDAYVAVTRAVGGEVTTGGLLWVERSSREIPGRLARRQLLAAPLAPPRIPRSRTLTTGNGGPWEAQGSTFSSRMYLGVVALARRKAGEGDPPLERRLLKPEDVDASAPVDQEDSDLHFMPSFRRVEVAPLRPPFGDEQLRPGQRRDHVAHREAGPLQRRPEEGAGTPTALAYVLEDLEGVLNHLPLVGLELASAS